MSDMPEANKDDTPPPQSQPEAEPRLRPTYDSLRQLMQIARELSFDTNAETDREDDTNAAPMVRMANAIITTGLELGASDIHLESDRHLLRVRLRIDGRLQEIMRIPKHLQRPTLNRFKVMAEIDFWRLAPQTGVIPIKHIDKLYNLQVRTTQSEHGEYLTLHVIECRRIFSLRERHFPLEIQAVMEDQILDGGLFLFTGPAGCGKTTMAYTWLNRLNDVENAVATIENTASYNHSGMVQTYYKGKTASDAVPPMVRNLLDQQVKALYVDDVNDSRAASAVLDAAEYGAITLASLTAPSVPHVFKRLQQLGLAPERLAVSLSGILFQVPVAQVCSDCREEVPFDKTQQAVLDSLFNPGRISAEDDVPIEKTYRGTGCEACRKTGIKGQNRLFAYVKFDEEERRLLQAGNMMELKRSIALAMANYYLERCARAALREGRVSLEELYAVMRPVVANAGRVV